MLKSVSYALVIVLALMMAGCAGKQTPTFTAKYYPQCYDPIDKLCKDQSNSKEIGGTVVGATIGALGGAAIGLIATGDWRGAVAGAVAGGVAGGVAGFWKARLDKIQDQNERLAEYQRALGEQSAGWDLERATVEKSYQCYIEQIELLKKAYQAKEITREAFLERANEIKAGVNYINTYWADAQSRMDETLVSGEKYLAEQDALVEKASAAEKKRTQAQRKKSSNDMTRTRQTVASKNKQTNALKEKTDKMVAELDDIKFEEGNLRTSLELHIFLPGHAGA